MLQNSGFDFQQHKMKGIPHSVFAEYIITSGLCFNPNNKWITFNGGFDFAYLLKCFAGQDLPDTEPAFFKQLNDYFCNYYDIKEMKRDMDYLSGGLNRVAKELNVDRFGISH